MKTDSDLKYRAAIETSADGFWITDMKGRILEVNQAYVRMTGFTEDELLRMHIPDLEARERPEETRAHIETILATGHDRFETLHWRKDRSLLPVEITVNYWSIEDGRMFVFIKDISDRRDSEKKLADAARFPEENPNPIARIGEDGNLLYLNLSAKNLFDGNGHTAIPENLRLLALSAYRNQEVIHNTLSFPGKDYQFCFAPAKGEPYVNIYGMDVTELKRAREKILVLSRAVEQSPVSVVITDLSGNINYVNPKFTEVTGYTPEEVLGKNPRILKSGRQPPEFYREMWETIIKGREWRGEFCNIRKNGEEYWESATISAVLDSDGQAVSFIAVKEDITDRKRKEAQIHYLAMHDQLTGLYNRTSFQEYLEKATALSRRTGEHFTLVYMDLNGFKSINDRYGHKAGDFILKKVALDIKNSVRSMDTPARLGGDEFAVILPNTSCVKGCRPDEAKSVSVLSVIERITKAVTSPAEFESHICRVGISIGVAEFPYDADNPECLIHNADKAMYAAKNHTDKNYVLFSSL